MNARKIVTLLVVLSMIAGSVILVPVPSVMAGTALPGPQITFFSYTDDQNDDCGPCKGNPGDTGYYTYPTGDDFYDHSTDIYKFNAGVSYINGSWWYVFDIWTYQPLQNTSAYAGAMGIGPNLFDIFIYNPSLSTASTSTDAYKWHSSVFPITFSTSWNRLVRINHETLWIDDANGSSIYSTNDPDASNSPVKVLVQEVTENGVNRGQLQIRVKIDSGLLGDPAEGMKALLVSGLNNGGNPRVIKDTQQEQYGGGNELDSESGYWKGSYIYDTLLTASEQQVNLDWNSASYGLSLKDMNIVEINHSDEISSYSVSINDQKEANTSLEGATSFDVTYSATENLASAVGDGAMAVAYNKIVVNVDGSEAYAETSTNYYGGPVSALTMGKTFTVSPASAVSNHVTVTYYVLDRNHNTLTSTTRVYWQKLTETGWTVTPTPYVTTNINATLTINAPIDETGLPYRLNDAHGNVVAQGTFDIVGGTGNIVLNNVHIPEGDYGTWTIDLPYGHTKTFTVYDYATADITGGNFVSPQYLTSPVSVSAITGTVDVAVTATCVPSATQVVVAVYVDDYTTPAATQALTATYAAYAANRELAFNVPVTINNPSSYVLVELKDLDGNILDHYYAWVNAQLQLSASTIYWTDSTIQQTVTATALYPTGIPYNAGQPIDDKTVTFKVYAPSGEEVTSSITNTGSASLVITATQQGDYTVKVFPYGTATTVKSNAVEAETVDTINIDVTPFMSKPASGALLSATLDIVANVDTYTDHYYRSYEVSYYFKYDLTSGGTNMTQVTHEEFVLQPGETHKVIVATDTLDEDIANYLKVHADDENGTTSAEKLLWANYSVTSSPTIVYASTSATYAITSTIKDWTGATVTSGEWLFVRIYDPAGNLVKQIDDGSTDDGKSDPGVISYTLSFTQPGPYKVVAIYGSSNTITSTYKPVDMDSAALAAQEYNRRPLLGDAVTGTTQMTFTATDYYTIYTATAYVVIDNGSVNEYPIQTLTGTIAPHASDITITRTITGTIPVDTTGAKAIWLRLRYGTSYSDSDIWRAYNVTASPTTVYAGISSDYRYTITGTVTDENGSLRAGAEVKIYDPDKALRDTITATTGTFTYTATFNKVGNWTFVDGFGAHAVVTATSKPVDPSSGSVDAPIFNAKPTAPFSVSGTVSLTFSATDAYTYFDIDTVLVIDGVPVATETKTGHLNPSTGDIPYSFTFSLSSATTPTTTVYVKVYSRGHLVAEKRLWAAYTINVSPSAVYAGLASVATYSITATVIDPETGGVATDAYSIVIYDPTGATLTEILDNSADDTNSTQGVIGFTLTATRLGDYKLVSKYGATAYIHSKPKPALINNLTNEGPVYPSGISAGSFTATGVITMTINPSDYYQIASATIGLLSDGSSYGTATTATIIAPTTASKTYEYNYAITTTFATAPSQYVRSSAAAGALTSIHTYWDHWTVTVTPTTVVADSDSVVYTFTGTVMNSSGNPVSGTQVTLKRPDGTTASTTYTDAAGRFVINTTVNQTGYWKFETLFGYVLVPAQYGTNFAQSVVLENPSRYDSITSTPYTVSANIKVTITATDFYLKVPVTAVVYVDGATAAVDSTTLNFNPGQTVSIWPVSFSIDTLPTASVYLVAYSGTVEDHWYVYGYAPIVPSTATLVDVPKWTESPTAPFDVTATSQISITATDVWSKAQVQLEMKYNVGGTIYIVPETVNYYLAPSTTTATESVTFTGTNTPTDFVAVRVVGSDWQYVWKKFDIQVQTATYIGKTGSQTVTGTVTVGGLPADNETVVLVSPSGVHTYVTVTDANGVFTFNVPLDEIGTWKIKMDYGNEKDINVVRALASVTYMDLQGNLLSHAPAVGDTIPYTIHITVTPTDAFTYVPVTVKYYINDTYMGSNMWNVNLEPNASSVTATDSYTVSSTVTTNIYITAEYGLYSDTIKPWANWSVALTSTTVQVDLATQTVTGTVYNEYGNTSAVAGSIVTLYRNGVALASSTVASDGSFAIDYQFVNEGEYAVTGCYGATAIFTVVPKQAVPTSIEVTSSRMLASGAITSTLDVPYTVTIDIPDYNVDAYMDVHIALVSDATEVTATDIHITIPRTETATTIQLTGILNVYVNNGHFIRVKAEASGVQDYYVVYEDLEISAPATVYAQHNATLTGTLKYYVDDTTTASVNTTDFTYDALNIRVQIIKDGTVIDTASVVNGVFTFTGLDLSQTGTYELKPTLFASDSYSINVVYGVATGTQSLDGVTPDHFYYRPQNATATVSVNISVTPVGYITATDVVVSLEDSTGVIQTKTEQVIIPENATSAVVSITFGSVTATDYLKVVHQSTQQYLWKRYTLTLDSLGTVQIGDTVNISGIVKDYTGNGVDNISVILVKPDGTVVATVTTDAAGRFLFTSVTVDMGGTWTVKTTEETYYTADTFEVTAAWLQTVASSIEIGDIHSYTAPTGTITVPVTVNITATTVRTYVNIDLTSVVDGSVVAQQTATAYFDAGATHALVSIDIAVGTGASEYVRIDARDLGGTATDSAYAWKKLNITANGEGYEGQVMTLTGSVTDYIGAAVAGEVVKVYAPSGAEVATATTDASGNYSVTFTPNEYGTWIVKTTTYYSEATFTVYKLLSASNIELSKEISYYKPTGTVSIPYEATITLASAATVSSYVEASVGYKIDGTAYVTDNVKVIFNVGESAKHISGTIVADTAGLANRMDYFVGTSSEIYWEQWFISVVPNTATIGVTTAISGHVEDYLGHGLAYVEVGLYAPDGTLVATTTTEIDATYEFDGSLLTETGTWTVKTVNNGMNFYTANEFNVVSVSSVVTVNFVLTPGWNFVSIPVQATVTLGEIFNVPGLASTVYDLDHGTFIYANDEVPVVGRGYWVKNTSDHNITVSVSGEIIDTDVVVNRNGSGWVSIGNPFNGSYDLDNIVIEYNGEVAHGLAEAVSRGWISNSIFTYANGTWIALSTSDTLSAQEAIIVKVLVTGSIKFTWVK